jgi:signal peptidase I
VVIVALALALALGIQAFLIKPYQIPSGSMEPTLDEGQRVLVNRFIYHFKDPAVGNIVVFHPPTGADFGGECGGAGGQGTRMPCSQPTARKSDQNFIKRIVATPGDTVQIVEGVAVVNGKISTAANGHLRNGCLSAELPPPTDANVARLLKTVPPNDCTFPDPITVPDNEYFMMGDNRHDSEDSRYWGPVPKDWFIGQAFATYWPPDRIGIF